MPCAAKPCHILFFAEEPGDLFGRVFFFEHEGSQPENVVFLSLVISFELLLHMSPVDRCFGRIVFRMFDTFDELLMY